jgi:hypothetical protein
MDVSDSTNITGISRLINYDGETDIEELERDIINDINNTSEITDVEQYKSQLEKLGNTLGLSLNDDNDDDGDDDGDDNGDDNGDDILDEEPTPYKQKNINNSNKYNSEDIDDMFNKVPSYRPKPDSYMGRVTEEQKKQKILRHVLDGVEDQKFSVEKEKEEDDKAILLEQIDMLITSLKDEGIDVGRIPDVNNTSSIEDIENVHKILRLKNDRNRYCSFAEECILAGSHTLEWLFDGKRTYMGRRPDLRGWSATVNIKLRRMRYDTSTFVSDVMQDYNLGHGTRIIFELLPSLFLYSKMKKSQYSDNLITSDEMNFAIDRIRDIEEKSSNKQE